MSEPGRFITLEGGEGAGKSTQARLLADALRARGVDVVLTREPGGTAGAEAIRALLLDPAGEGWPMRAEALLFAAARADHVARLIRPALARGQWVICDRFIDSNRAYQGAGGGLPDSAIRSLHDFGSEGLLPDMTLLIEVAPQEAALRAALRDGQFADRIGSRDPVYHYIVGKIFEVYAEDEPHRFTRIDGNTDRDTTHVQIMAAVAPLLAPIA